MVEAVCHELVEIPESLGVFRVKHCIGNAVFQMYDDDFISPVARTTVSSYRPARFPTKNIVTPIVLLYGDTDGLVHIETILSQLPEHAVAKPLRTYEHLDILWRTLSSSSQMSSPLVQNRPLG